MQKIDLYLSRVSQFVQIGLFATTLFTIYYTVIPLYKNAQLEESLARKELEYESLKQRSDKTLSKINAWEYRQFAVSSAECSGVPKVLLENHAEPDMQKYPPAEIIACMRRTLSEYDFTDLNAAQRTEIENRISAMFFGINGIFQDSLNKYDDYPSVLDRQLAEGKVPESSIDKLDKIFNELGYRISDAEKRESYISAERYKLQLAYFSEVSRFIISRLGDRQSLEKTVP